MAEREGARGGHTRGGGKTAGDGGQPQSEATDRRGPGGATVTDQNRGDDTVSAQDIVGAKHGAEATDDDRLTESADGVTAAYQPNPEADPGTPPRIIDRPGSADRVAAGEKADSGR